MSNGRDGGPARAEKAASPALYSPVQSPSISLPKGGGAIRGIGEKFAANPVTGTGVSTVPIATSPGRSGLGPQLALSYDSGAGNGPFGFGWSLGLPRISRQTDKGLPQYRDAEESDVFVLSGSEDLVPVLGPDGGRFEDATTVPGHTVHRYRPRVEGPMARIERWTRNGDGDVHWRTISRDNILSVYGKDQRSRIADPADPRRIFAWLICETRDDKGDGVVYEYKQDDGVGVDLKHGHEGNRGGLGDPRRTANRYIKRIRYGNRTSLLDDAGRRPGVLTDDQIKNAGWMFEVVFDYGEHDTAVPKPGDSGPWRHREDAFSSYRAGFEVRTSRLCRRVLMFHHFEHEDGVGNDCLVRSTDFAFSGEQNPVDTREPVYAFLHAVTQTGYKRKGEGYLRRSMPAVEYEYTRPVLQHTVHDVDASDLENLPIGLDGSVYQWTDLHGEGIPGVFSEQGGAWFYKGNLSPISARQVELAPMECAASKPSVALAGGQAQFMDLAGDGRPDLVVQDGPMPGWYEHDGDRGWEPFRPFVSRLNRDMRDPNLRFVDLTGDGHADVLVTENDAFVWHDSLGEQGFGPARRVHRALDEETGPRLVFADGAQSVYLGDMSGDGLTDLVRIRDGEVCYWPNLGYGRFGAKVTMDNAPHFDCPDQFDHARVRLADIDGSGTTDIVYLGGDGVRLYFNQSGNSWSDPRPLDAFPQVENLAAVTLADLLGNGTVCLVWSSRLPGDAQRRMRYVNLMGEQKPHLLVRTVNNLGAETRVEYASSVKFYLRDKYAGKPWITKLPFPVHVVERIETIDAVSGNRFVTRYGYHHGYFDGQEREFRGFGMVEQWDTEEFGFRSGTNEEPATDLPPVLTRTWFHTGAHVDADRISGHFAGEYYREETPGRPDVPGPGAAGGAAMLLADTVLPTTVRQPDGSRSSWPLSAEEEREARRALRGSVLRQEIYALDGTEAAGLPYRVAERNYTVELLQPRIADNRHAVFFTHPRESVEFHYERAQYRLGSDRFADPRVSHAVTLDVDVFGNVQRAVSIAYGRRVADPHPVLTDDDRAKQRQLLLTCTETDYTNPVHEPDAYRVPLSCASRTYELLQTAPAAPGLDETGRPVTPLFNFEELRTRLDEAAAPGRELPYEDVGHAGITAAGPHRRLIEHLRTRFRSDDLTGLLRDGELQPRALPGESYRLAYTPGLLAGVYRRAGQDLLPADPAGLLNGEGGYVRLDGDSGWWIPSGRAFHHPDGPATPGQEQPFAAQELAFAREHFFLPHRFVDAFGNATVVGYDAHHLQAVHTRDPAGNTVRAEHDYRVLAARQVTDANGNRSEAAFDCLGLVVAIAVKGKATQDAGDSLAAFAADPGFTDPELPALQAFVADPHRRSAALLDSATTRVVYDLHRFARCGQPPLAAALTREVHAGEPAPAGGVRIQVAFVYSDGFGREVQSKVPAEPGEAPVRDADLPVEAGDPPRPTGDIRPGPLRDGGAPAPAARRWVGQGRTVYDNKGNPVRQYEPFFSSTHLCEDEKELTDTGVSPLLCYDPVGRVVVTLRPDDTYEKVVFDPWRQANWDTNDTVQLDPRTDPDVAAIVRAHFADRPAIWQTWFARRIGGAHGTTPADQAAAQSAAKKAAEHAATPGLAFSDSLGRPFLTVADNGPSGNLPTRVDLDIEGNRRAVTDARGIAVMRGDFDMAGNSVCTRSPDAGERWTLPDVTGKPIRSWDGRGFQRRMSYDELRRLLAVFVTDAEGERCVQRTVYGEAIGEGANHRGRVHKVFDGSGLLVSEAYDFKGNLLRGTRRLLSDHRSEIDWPDESDPAVDALLETEAFTGATVYDALNRPVQEVAPHSNRPDTTVSVTRPGYNEAGLLERMDAWLDQPDEPSAPLDPDSATQRIVGNIDYNARGQRVLVEYGNGVRTAYDHDPLTFRLRRLTTRRGGDLLQDLTYDHDPVGNITSIRDGANDLVFHDQQVVAPGGEYRYDAVYRLVAARGREHRGGDRQVGHDPDPWTVRTLPNDGQALRNYIETYTYDSVGNILGIRHHEGPILDSPGAVVWHRRYQYAVDSNRLMATSLPGDPKDLPDYVTAPGYSAKYQHDAHGNMTALPHLTSLEWDDDDRLRSVDVGGGARAFYTYDVAGQRVRKVREKAPGLIEERIYLGGLEVFRVRTAGSLTLERQTLHLMDDSSRVATIESRTHLVGADPSPVRLVRFQLGNHLGSVVLELDADAQIISYEEYHPYGTTAYSASRSETETPKRYRYTGRERDEESGLYHFGARYYAPWIGRWCSPDPGGLIDGANLFQYAHGNPAMMVDPTGFAAEPGQGVRAGELLPPEFLLRIKVVATEKTSGITQKMREKAQSFYHTATGRPGKEAQLAHEYGSEAATTRPGETVYVRPQRGPENVKGSGSIRSLVGKIRKGIAEGIKNRGYARTTKGHDPGAAAPAATSRQHVSPASRPTGAPLPKSPSTRSPIVDRVGMRGSADPALVRGLGRGTLTVVTGLLALKDLKADLKAHEYGRAVASGAGVATSATEIAAGGAGLVTGVSSSGIGLGAGVGGMGVAEGIAAAPHVVGAFALGAATGVALQEGSAALSKKYLGTEISPGRIIGDALTAQDNLVSKIWADPSKPAHTQTLGWKIAGWLTD
ncbi:SpvB/TcaC N-terminal domain-containing protein [Actinomadura rubrisoli]|uniref:Toxin n=1 Tax=Actinomadura rubrisoli TaxID=2530368 RepID=A0A4V2YYJ0_9ACTN|nr:SpvB/TcaC N-terminal domain-containing protein [Actinomadura rubrisoli]TDD93347.1 toxin [Actinomadura rubrisoli]